MEGNKKDLEKKKEAIANMIISLEDYEMQTNKNDENTSVFAHSLMNHDQRLEDIDKNQRDLHKGKSEFDAVKHKSRPKVELIDETKLDALINKVENSMIRQSLVEQLNEITDLVEED